MTLYDYTNSYRELYDHLADAEDMTEWQAEIDSLDQDFEQKVHHVAAFIKELDAEASAIKEEESRLAARKKSAQKKADWLKAMLLDAMKAAGRRKVKTTLFTIGIQNNPPSVQLPEGYDPKTSKLATCKTTWSADKKRMLELLKAGEDAEGATLVQGESVRIR